MVTIPVNFEIIEIALRDVIRLLYSLTQSNHEFNYNFVCFLSIIILSSPMYILSVLYSSFYSVLSVAIVIIQYDIIIVYN